MKVRATLTLMSLLAAPTLAAEMRPNVLFTRDEFVTPETK